VTTLREVCSGVVSAWVGGRYDGGGDQTTRFLGVEGEATCLDDLEERHLV
jgi:hypothetical protein